MDTHDGLDAIETRHLQVHQDNIGLEDGGFIHGLLPIAGLADDLHIGLGAEHHHQTGTYHRMIIDDENPNHHASREVASRKSQVASRVPAPTAPS